MLLLSLLCYVMLKFNLTTGAPLREFKPVSMVPLRFFVFAANRIIKSVFVDVSAESKVVGEFVRRRAVLNFAFPNSLSTVLEGGNAVDLTSTRFCMILFHKLKVGNSVMFFEAY